MQDLSTNYLLTHHREELLTGSAISPDVIAERGYVSISRPTNSDQRTREEMRRLGFPSWAIKEDWNFPGLHIPGYSPTGVRYAGQFKPQTPVSKDGKRLRYASAKGPARLDVHPRWSRDRGQDDPAVLPAIQDPAMRLWITEGVKKADSLTSRGEVTVALSGVFNWRNGNATLGDWEDVRIKGREVVICFDADAISKPQVARAMDRLGKWLKSKGASKVWFLVVPPGVNGISTKGVDDFFAAGGTVKELEQSFETRAPQMTDTSDRFTDARLAETMAEEVLDGRYVWAAGLDWLAWDGKRWAEAHEVSVLEAVRLWALDNFAEAAAKLKLDDRAAGSEVEGWKTMLSASRARTVLGMARGIVERAAADFDADPDILNTPEGMVRLDTDEVLQHDPEALCTKITSGSYRPGFTHPDWDRALTVLPLEVAGWMQTRVGQAITGHTTADGVVPILKGGGENGKGLLTTDGLLPALGGYAEAASPKLFMGSKSEHSTERADLRGQRLVIVEELTEGRSIDTTALKQIADVGRIKARKIRKDNVEFEASHSIFATTNYTPVVAETDHGTWRRLALVEFPYTFVKPGIAIRDAEHERRGDPTLKSRIKANRDGQHDAAVTWAVDGARRWYANTAAIEAAVSHGEEPPASVLLPPPAVAASTLAWRREADRILGYWGERLVVDPGAWVLTSEVTEDFNEWLREGGHGPWAKETFRPRFAEHAETKANHVTGPHKKRTDSAEVAGRIVRRVPAGGWAPAKALPRQAELYRGLRWRVSESDL